MEHHGMDTIFDLAINNELIQPHYLNPKTYG